MSGTFAVVMGDRGRLVVPAALRAAAGLAEGTPLVLVGSPGGVVVMTRKQAREHLRRQLADTDVVAQLLEERRMAARDDAA